jgi:hypothetical protein
LSIGCMTCSDEHVHTTLCNAVSRAVDHRRTLFTASLSVSRVLVSVWVLDIAQIVVSWFSAARVVAIVGCDVAVAEGGSERETRGLGASGGQQGCV